ncbi:MULTISPECIES: NADP-dependent phosphogluconate dehydrogenase [unclassified Salipiger]|uniref:NADP-dependent phosphogluconate dehydrogenase n=1 Tax=unclassified Salipiger TaxID=2640570 RepID=UPI0013BB0B1A|nr:MULTISPECIES: NADP-dependent phosphogluconate dehydrogenase [unclassified Salipiger]NDV49106.1 NADP-dependent phosphogluconate dehydrogenase [Salipiger sp. PrR003]NDW31364.1 NADP-dependent phosphogluconate dehydrogenase [Salipiger sp. PrR007]
MADPRIGIYGLGTMGAALALNMADKGIDIAVSNRSDAPIAEFMTRAAPFAAHVTALDTLEELIAALPRPRLLLAMIPSTAPMDEFLAQVIPLLATGDTVIDAGNADFHATRARSAQLAEHGLHFVGLGVSGGEEGARHGPSMMFGGSEESWAGLQPILSKIAAQFDGAPCADRMGPDGAGHFVKTVHNGIEYADMQMIAEVYDLLRHGAGLSPTEVGAQFARWNDGPLESYLFEITGTVLSYDDPLGHGPMVDAILDRAGQKGTGRWTAIEAVQLGQSATMIEGAVAARAWSAEKDLREVAGAAFGSDRASFAPDFEELEAALLAARILEYAQGFRILAAASAEYGWQLDFARIAEIWRAGCIIRARLLDDISAAFRETPPEGQLFLAPRFAPVLEAGIPALRRLVSGAIAAGYPLPVLGSALEFWDTLRQPRGTAALIQAQRDFFGRHGFDRVDGKEAHHGPWWN